MAQRCLLHISKLDNFKDFLTLNKYEIQDCKGLYEVLRAKKDKDTIIIFKKDRAEEHLSVQNKDIKLVKKFISKEVIE